MPHKLTALLVIAVTGCSSSPPEGQLPHPELKRQEACAAIEQALEDRGSMVARSNDNRFPYPDPGNYEGGRYGIDQDERELEQMLRRYNCRISI